MEATAVIPHRLRPGWIAEARGTLRLAVPMITGQLAHMAMQFCDALMVGYYLGVVPLAASALAISIQSPAFVASIGLMSAVGVRSAQALGAGQRDTAGEVLRHGMIMGLATGVVLAIALWLAEPFFHHMRQDPEVVRQAMPFLRFFAWSIVPTLLWQALKQYCEAHNLARPPMWTALAGVSLNLGLNYALIFGHFGAPALGLPGSGLATLLARCALFLMLAGWAWHSPALRDEIRAIHWLRRPRWLHFRALLGIGIPGSIQLLMEVAAFAGAALMMGYLSARALAAHQIAITYAATTFMVPLGLSFATSLRLGQAFGAGERERLRRIGFGGLTMAAGVMCAGAILFSVFGRWLAGWFTTDPEVIAIAAALLAVAGVFQIVDGIQVVGMSALRGLSDVRVPTLIAFCAYWVVALPLCYWLGFYTSLGAVGIWWGLAAGLACAATLLVWRLAKRTRVN
jgi:MATE family multidrug resistance protein